MTQLIGARPRPRVLVRWKGEGSQKIIDAVSGFAPTVAGVRLLSSLRLSEWDAVITDTALGETFLPPHLSVIRTFYEAEHWRDDADKRAYVWAIMANLVCNEFRPPNPDLEPSLQHLIRSDLLPTVQRRTVHSFVRSPLPPYGDEPFLVAANGAILACRYRRGPEVTTGEVWLIPQDVPDIVPWIRLAFERWHLMFPDRFPLDIGWRSRAEWWTAEEAAVEADLASLEETRAAVTAELDRRRLELVAAREAAAKAADAGPRRLLTAQGQDLVAAVTSTLRTFGFQVDDERDSDTTRSDLLEDLYITDPADPDWDALVEVRGYAGGAKGNDLQRIGRFVERFIVKHGRPPAARWYVVSQSVGDDPSGRRPPLGGSEDIPIFADAGGLVIETKELHMLLRMLETNSLSADEIRAALRKNTGIFDAAALAT